MTARVLKWSVPIDAYAAPHRIGVGPVLHVECQHGPDTVEVWTLEHDDPARAHRPVQVFGTGHPIPDKWAPLGSAVTMGGALVWHVFAAHPEEWGPG